MRDDDTLQTSLYDRFGRTFAPGAVLFQEGDPGQEMFVIQTGHVELTRRVRGQESHLATLPPGEFFGEMAIINHRPRSATATVSDAGEAKLLVIDGRTFEAMIRGNAEIAVRLVKKLAGRLQQANAQVEVLLKQDANHRVAFYLRRLADERGLADGPGVRVDISVEEVASATGVSAREVADCLERLAKARLVYPEPGSIYIAEVGKLEQFLEFLDMKERFGG